MFLLSTSLTLPYPKPSVPFRVQVPVRVRGAFCDKPGVGSSKVIFTCLDFYKKFCFSSSGIIVSDFPSL